MNNFFETFKKLIKTLQSTRKYTLKKHILSKYENNEKIKKILALIFNKNIKTNITSKKLITFKKKQLNISNNINTPNNIFELFLGLSNGKWSGNLACKVVWNYIDLHKKYEDIILMILDKKINIGMNIKEINKSFQVPIIRDFSVALADNFKTSIKYFENHKNDMWYISKKIDGVRWIVRCNFVDPGKWKITSYTRQGKIKQNITIIESYFKKIFGDLDTKEFSQKSYVFDGELCYVDNKGNQQFQKTISKVLSKAKITRNVVYYIFDLLYGNEFDLKKSKRTLISRYNLLQKILPNKKLNDSVNIVSQVEWSVENFVNAKQKSCELKWEGLILRRNCEYKGKRSKDILKVKEMFSDEFKVIGINVSTKYISGKKTNIVGSVTIQVDGNNVNVGSGLSDIERINFYKNPHNILGKTIEVQYFEKSINKKGETSLRFPVIKCIWGDSRKI
jgi:DNA ligase-1